MKDTVSVEGRARAHDNRLPTVNYKTPRPNQRVRQIRKRRHHVLTRARDLRSAAASSRSTAYIATSTVNGGASPASPTPASASCICRPTRTIASAQKPRACARHAPVPTANAPHQSLANPGAKHARISHASDPASSNARKFRHRPRAHVMRLQLLHELELRAERRSHQRAIPRPVRLAILRSLKRVRMRSPAHAPVLHSSITRYPSGPSCASAYPSGASARPDARTQTRARETHRTPPARSARAIPLRALRSSASAAARACADARAPPETPPPGHPSAVV